MGGLATMFLAAFGVSLSTLMDIASKAIMAKDHNLIMLAFTAGVQIRAHVVFVGRDFGDVRVKYPALIIEGSRPQSDIYNFGALHALGHIFAHVTSNALGRKVISKAGSCITGESLTESEAGKINKEIFTEWGADDKAAFPTWLTQIKASAMTIVDEFMTAVPKLAKDFGKPAVPPAPTSSGSGSSKA
jgi:hypothetical protein